MKILIGDDEKPLVHFLEKGFRAEGYTCYSVNELHDVVPTIKKYSPQVVVLDRMFGSQDSVVIIDAIKSLPDSPMVMLLTALDDVNERVKGLQKGADDYLCKPFDFDELLARVTALCRRNNQNTKVESNVLTLGDLEIQLDERIALLENVELGLTKIEFELLLYLTENQKKVLSRERILSRVWQTHSDPNTNIVDVYISRLRKKFDDDQKITIETLRGNGYRLWCADGQSIIN